MGKVIFFHFGHAVIDLTLEFLGKFKGIRPYSLFYTSIFHECLFLIKDSFLTRL